MYICLCSGYKTSDLKRDIEKNLSVKEIIQENGIDEGCKKCCSLIKNEYREMKGQYDCLSQNDLAFAL